MPDLPVYQIINMQPISSCKYHPANLRDALTHSTEFESYCKKLFERIHVFHSEDYVIQNELLQDRRIRAVSCVAAGMKSGLEKALKKLKAMKAPNTCARANNRCEKFDKMVMNYLYEAYAAAVVQGAVTYMYDLDACRQIFVGTFVGHFIDKDTL